MFEHIRFDSKPISTFFVMGERCSGTNYLNWIVNRNVQVTPLGIEYWKHGFPVFDAIPRRMAIIVSYRNAISWLLSLYANPWHTSPEMQTLNFSQFIRHPWETVIDSRYLRKKYVNTPLIGTPLQHDRDPITGKPFKNVLEMRTAKIRSLEGLRNRSCNIIYSRQEDVSKYPGEFIEKFCEIFELERKSDEILTPQRRLGGWPESIRRTAPDRISDEDLEFIKGELDLDLETSIGYRY